MENKEYNPLEIREGLLVRFWSRIKKQAKMLWTIAGISLLFTGLQTYKAFFAPNMAQEFAKTITNMIAEFNTYTPVQVPDSLMGDEEVRLLSIYQSEFEIYKLRLSSLIFNRVPKEGANSYSILLCKWQNFISYQKESQNMLEMQKRIVSYERSLAKNEDFASTIDIRLFYELADKQNECIQIYNKAYEQIKERKTRKEIIEKVDCLFENEVVLEEIELQRELHKTFFIATSVRLLEIVNQKKFNLGNRMIVESK